jgi:hypothetical protein
MKHREGFLQRAHQGGPVASLTRDPCWVPEAILVLGQTCRAHLQQAQIWVLEGAQLIHRDHLPMGEPAEMATGSSSSDMALQGHTGPRALRPSPGHCPEGSKTERQTNMQANTYTFSLTLTHIHTHFHIHIHVPFAHIHIHFHSYMYIQVHCHIFIHFFMHIHNHTYMHTLHTNIHLHIHIYTCKLARIYAHTSMHILNMHIHIITHVNTQHKFVYSHKTRAHMHTH